MEENKNIFFKHSLESYNKKYRNRRHKILKYTKKQVEEFDKKYQGKVEKNYLLKGRKWTLIGDTYYEIPKAPTYKWFRNLSTSAQVAICLLLGGGVATGVALPVALNRTTIPQDQYFNVNFDSDGGPTIDTQKIKPNGLVSEPSREAVVRSDAYFEYWEYKGKKWDFENDVVTSDMTLKAVWNTQTYTVQYKVNGTVTQTDNYPYNANVNRPKKDPEDTFSGNNQAFDYWKDTSTGQEFDFKNDKVKGDVVLEAVFAESVAVKLYDDQACTGTLLNTVYIKKGSTCPRQDKPNLDEGDYCSFEGWCKEGSTTVYTFNEAVNSELKLWPKWTAKVNTFQIIGNHNFDLDSSMSVLTLVDTVEGDTSSSSYEPDVSWSSSNEDIVTVEDGKMFIVNSTKGGSVTITATRSYEMPGGAEDVKVSSSFEVEVASFNKLDTSYLLRGQAHEVDGSISGAVVIPSRYYNTSTSSWVWLSKVADGAFEGNKEITSIQIPAPTVAIGARAFYGCDNIVTLDFVDKTNTWMIPPNKEPLDPNNYEDLQKMLETLKVSTVANDKVPTSTGLTFTQKNDGTWKVKYDQTLQVQLEYICLPSWYYVDSEGKGHTVYNSSYSKEVNELEFTSGVGAFESCTCAKLFTIPSSVNFTKITENAFKGCTNLESVCFLKESISSTNETCVNELEDSAFAGSGITTITLPNYVTKIHNSVFDSCTKLSTVSLPTEIEELGTGTFKGCEKLDTVNIPTTGITEIPESTFEDCDSLGAVHIPFNIVKLGKKSFYNDDASSGLKTIDFDDYLSTWSYTGAVNPLDISHNLYRYAHATTIKGLSVEIIKEVDSSKDSYFTFTPDDASNPTSFTVSYNSSTKESISELYIPAFHSIKVDGKTKTLPVTKIKDSGFKNNTLANQLTYIYIPDTVEKIGESAFSGLSNVTEVRLPKNDNFTEIASYTFYNCSSLKTINIPSSVTKICSWAFIFARQLKSADFGINSYVWKRRGSILGIKYSNVTTYSNTLDEDALASNADLLTDLLNKLCYWERTNDEVMNGVYVSLAKETYAINDIVPLSNFTITKETNKGSTDVTDTNTYKICEYVSSDWVDVTSQIKNNTYKKTTAGTSKYRVELTDNKYTYKSSEVTISYAIPESEDNFNYYEEDGVYWISEKMKGVDGFTGYTSSTIILPSTHNGKKVVKIASPDKTASAKGGFEEIGNQMDGVVLEKVVLSDNITIIGGRGFANDGGIKLEFDSNLEYLEPESLANYDNTGDQMTLVFPKSVYCLDCICNYPSEKFGVYSVRFIGFEKDDYWDINSGESYFQYRPQDFSYTDTAVFLRNNAKFCWKRPIK